MMALSGVRISWLILARKSDLAEEAFSAWCLAVRELLLHFFPSGDVAKHHAEPVGPVAGRSHGHEHWDQGATGGAADNLAPAVAHARAAVVGGMVETIVGRLHAFGSEQLGERAAGEFARLVAEQRLGAAVGGHDEAVRIEHDEAVSGSIEQGGQLGKFGLRALELCRFCRPRASVRAASMAPAGASASSPIGGGTSP